MSPDAETGKQAGVPGMAALLMRYLDRASGLPVGEPAAEVEPYEVASRPRIDARLAWDEALAALTCQQPGSLPKRTSPPPHWDALIGAAESATALPFAAGCFPQQVRELPVLLQATDLTTLRPKAVRPADAATDGSGVALRDWAAKLATGDQPALALAAVGVLRLARQVGAAGRMLASLREALPAEWQAAWANEEAASLWQQGEWERAADLWQAMPESVPVLFNRGMAALFLGRSEEARASLAAAVRQLPDASAWHHLGQLYLALAQTRR